jgi:hypothetical protein
MGPSAGALVRRPTEAEGVHIGYWPGSSALEWWPLAPFERNYNYRVISPNLRRRALRTLFAKSWSIWRRIIRARMISTSVRPYNDGIPPPIAASDQGPLGRAWNASRRSLAAFRLEPLGCGRLPIRIPHCAAFQTEHCLILTEYYTLT